MPNARRLKDGIRSSVLAAENLLAKMMATAKTKQHVRHLNTMSQLTYTLIAKAGTTSMIKNSKTLEIP